MKFILRVAWCMAIVSCAAWAARGDDAADQRNAKAAANTRLALDLSRGSLEKKEYIDAVQLADLADRCARETNDAQFIATTRALTDAVRSKCPPEKVEEARKIIRELAGQPGPAPKVLASRPAVVLDRNRVRNSEFKLERGMLVMPAPIQFETGSDVLRPESDESLYTILDFLEAKPLITTLRIEAHTDNSGPESKTQALSEQRAAAVANWLVARGADPKRLLPVGFGSTKPIAANDTPGNKARNRRIAVYPAAMRGKAIGGQPLEGGGKVSKGWK